MVEYQLLEATVMDLGDRVIEFQKLTGLQVCDDLLGNQLPLLLA
jgi:hypothetical protein